MRGEEVNLTAELIQWKMIIVYEDREYQDGDDQPMSKVGVGQHLCLPLTQFLDDCNGGFHMINGSLGKNAMP